MAVVPVSYGWTDLGSWQAVWDELKTGDEQICTSPGLRLTSHNSKRVLVYSERPDDKLYACVGLEDVAIVDTGDALLVTRMDQCQDVKLVHAKVAQHTPAVAELPAKEFRPWGLFEILQEREGYKVKRLLVKPGFRLSLQSHQHRSEHWVVVQGTASVVNGEADLQLTCGEATYIPAGNKHRLANHGEQDLVVIETQTGTYLGEDDIKRYQDDFGR